jgi:hypothetical protein
MPQRIGLDVGGVLINFHGADNRKGLRRTLYFLRTRPVDGAFEAVRVLVQAFGANNVFIISRVKISWEIRLRLRCWRFYTHTGFLRQNLYFCRQRHEKGPIADCLPGGPLTHFADDRADVLSHMPNVATRYLFGIQTRIWPVPTDQFVAAPTWRAILQHLKLVHAL